MCSRRRNAPSVPASLQRSASASNRRFSLPENWRRLAITTTSGSRRAPSPEAVSPVALPAPSATASEEEPDKAFTNEVMFMSYLYSKLPETGVSPHIGTGGGRSVWLGRSNERTLHELDAEVATIGFVLRALGARLMRSKDDEHRREQ